MIEQNTDYRYGLRALLYMMCSRLKVPLIFAIVMVVISFVLFQMKDVLIGWETGGSLFLKQSGNILHLVERYGWFFTIILALFFALTILPEYFGMAFRLGDNALYLRKGIMSRHEMAIPYQQIQTITLIEKSSQRIFGVAGLAIITSGHDSIATAHNDGSAFVEPIPRRVAKVLEEALLSKMKRP